MENWLIIIFVKNLVGLFLVWTYLFPFHLSLIKRINSPLKLSHPYRLVAIYEDRVVVYTPYSYVAINGEGKILWRILALPSQTSFSNMENYILLFRGNRVFVHDKREGVLLKRYRMEPIPLSINVGKKAFFTIAGKDYLIWEKSRITPGKVKKYLEIYSSHGDRLVKEYSLPYGITPFDTKPSKNGVIILANAPCNHYLYGGVADFYGGIYLLGLTGRLVASYKIPGSYVVGWFLGEHNGFLWLLLSEDYRRAENSWVLIFDPAHWRLVKKRKVSFPAVPIYTWGNFFKLKDGGDLIPIVGRDGNVLLLDKELSIKSSLRLENLKHYKRSVENSEITLSIKYLKITSKYLLIHYQIYEQYLDPRHGGPIRLLANRFKIFSLKGRILYDLRLPLEKEAFLPILDIKKNTLSLLKGGSFEIYRIYP